VGPRAAPQLWQHGSCGRPQSDAMSARGCPHAALVHVATARLRCLLPRRLGVMVGRDMGQAPAAPGGGGGGRVGGEGDGRLSRPPQAPAVPGPPRECSRRETLKKKPEFGPTASKSNSGRRPTPPPKKAKPIGPNSLAVGLNFPEENGRRPESVRRRPESGARRLPRCVGVSLCSSSLIMGFVRAWRRPERLGGRRGAAGTWGR